MKPVSERTLETVTARWNQIRAIKRPAPPTMRFRGRAGVDMLNIAVAFLAIVATVLEAADVLSTYHMLARGGHEANPIVAWFMEVLGAAWPLCKIPEVILIGALWAFAPRPIALICLTLMSAGYAFVVWENYHI
jgi:hypothetical protein